MKWSTVTVGVMILGIIGVSIILLFQQLTTTNENDYYLLKEITEAAMVDSIDISYYRETGELKIVREKFVENFTFLTIFELFPPNIKVPTVSFLFAFF